MLVRTKNQANGGLNTFDHPQAGEIRQARAPVLGQRSYELMSGCGYSDDDIRQLVDAGSVQIPR